MQPYSSPKSITMKTMQYFLLAMLCSLGLYTQAQVFCGVNANFTYTVNPNGAYQFTSTSTTVQGFAITGYAWNFGNTQTSSQANPIVTFNNTGFYNVCLIVYGSLPGSTNTCSDTVCQTIYYNANCAAVIAGVGASAGTNSITATSTGSAPSGYYYQWWLNGQSTNTSQGQNLQSYTWSNLAPGTYQVCLYAYYTPNVFCDSACTTVTVTGANPCSGFAAAVQTTNNSNQSATLNAVTTGGAAPYSYVWSNNTTSQTQTVTQSGFYCVTVYDNNQCSAVACDSVIIGGGNPCNVNAGFQYTVQGNGAGFGAVSANTPATYTWSFGDGSTQTTTNPQISHSYPSNPASTTYLVCLTVAIPGTTCIDSFCQPIVIPGSGGQPCAGFMADFGQTTTPNGAVQLTAFATGGNAPYQFVWSNGSNGSVTTPTTTGVYCVTAYDNNQCSASFCDSVIVGGNPCNLTVVITPQQQGQVTVLVANVTGGVSPYTYYWNNNASSSAVLTVVQPGTYCLSVLDANGCVGAACYTVQGNVPGDTICGVVFNDANGNGVQDSTENGMAGATVYIGNYTFSTDSDGLYLAVVPSGSTTQNIYYCPPQGYTLTLPVTPNSNAGLSNCGFYTITPNNQQNLCGFNFGIQNNSATICGTVFFDANNNGTQDQNTENGLSGVTVIITSTNGGVFYAYTDNQGNYCKNLPAGSYSVSISSANFQGCNVAPQALTANLSVGQQLNSQNFAVYCQPGICNLKITITPHTTVTPGFPAWYDMQITNIGTGVASGTANFFYDAALVFNYTNPVQTSHNATTRTVSFAVNNLLPGQNLYYWLSFNALTSINLGAPVFTLANINPNCNDVNYTNNVDTIHQTVVGSWDPNNKLAYVTNHDPSPAFHYVSNINANQRIEYVINFQNTGTAPAVNVVVKDLLSADVDANSVEILGSSHPMVASRTGNELNFKFSNIMLPDSFSNEPASHGFVKFAVNAVNGLPGGHVISDEAEIYFDFNLPIITNDAAVTLLDPTGIEEIGTSATAVVFPNPMNGFAEFRISNEQPFALRLYDMTGRLVREERGSGGVLTFNRNGISSGVYTYQFIQNNQPSAKGKLVIQ